MRAVRLILSLTAVLCVLLPAVAQRRISPVRPETGKNLAKEVTDTIDVTRLREGISDEGQKIYIDTITGREYADSLVQMPKARVPRMLQPLLFSTTLGVDIWDPVMRAFGQKYGLIEFSGELNLHNRYIPVVEVGLGYADNTPARQNFTYHTGVTPYFRIGANYNFLYNSNPAYQAYAGIRLGVSPFSYRLTDVTVNSGYWDETTTMDFPRQSCTVVYMNLMFGIRVKIWGPVSMGWAFKFRTRLHESKTPMGKPWYIPGYGTRNGSVGGAFSIYYTLDLCTPFDTSSTKKDKQPSP